MRHLNALIILILASTLLFAKCKESDLSDTNPFIGKWVSSDKEDTLFFDTDSDLYKSTYHKIHDHFDYSYTGDSISIRYRGAAYIFVQFTSHKYHIQGDQLTIDFSNGCYSFESKIGEYYRAK